MSTAFRTDLKFFTNEPSGTLYDRFVKTLKDVQYFDVLVGYFRTSGFKRLYKSLESVEKIRILVGLSVDRNAFELIRRGQGYLDFDTHKQTKEKFEAKLIEELNYSEDHYDIEISARELINFIAQGKLELRAHPGRNIHAKVYISRYGEEDRDFGSVITGSSNFSENGLVAQREFNVELKDAPDVEYALKKFEELWQEGINISETYVDIIQTKTWLNDRITPYQLYLKFLYEYFKEDINVDQDIDFYLPDNFMQLAYQQQAVLSAKKILEAYNGVFLADVVGLGKTFISALLLQQLPGRKLIICPPVLADYWKATMFDFAVPQCRIESLGKLETVIQEGFEKYQYVLIDEAHRFRNEDTVAYENLQKICAGKKVILVSATPLNNRLTDILALLKLFQPAKKSTIPGTSNLQHFFDQLRLGLEKTLREVDDDRSDSTYVKAVMSASAKVRSKVLNHVMVRRTRTEIKNFFSEDLTKQGLSFPELMPPERIVYQFDETTEQIFDDTITLLKNFTYARYAPLLFLKKDVDQLVEQSQKNVRGFMKGILVKRLESSFHAFKNTVNRFINSYEQFINMFNDGTLYISKKVNVYDLLANDDEERLIHLVEQGDAQKYNAKDFKTDYLINLQKDLIILQQIKKMWQNVNHDPKLMQFINELKTNPKLKNQKIIIFTESKETGEYLHKKLEDVFPNKTLFYSSSGGQYKGVTHGVVKAREIIQDNFDPNKRTHNDDVRCLITTDILAEGINLHRANIIINYDLPWNPTRVLQRVGRVNRVGTAHKEVFVFNFFPTDKSDVHLGLEANIKAKLQSFHDTLGEDAKYLSDDEEVRTHGLFGNNLYDTLNNKNSLESETNERSELEYLQIIRNIRDDKPDLFKEIKQLPKKARSARKSPDGSKEKVISFFRKGRLKKFFLSDELTSKELEFFEAVDLLACDEHEVRISIPETYYSLLERNKKKFHDALTLDPAELSSRGGHSNERQLLKILKSRDIKKYAGFTDEDEAYLQSVITALEAGTIARKTIKTITDTLKTKGYKPLVILNTLKSHLLQVSLDVTTKSEQDSTPGEIILSAYFN